MAASEFKFQEPPAMGDPMLGKVFGILPAPKQDPPMINYRGYGLHQPFDLRERMKISRQKPMLGMWLGAFPYPNIGRISGQAGFDFVLIDWEHTPMSIENVVEFIKTIQYASEGRTAVIVRVPSHEHYYTAWLLDAGASGIIFPHTVEEAKKAVESARFPTHGGKRSGPPNAFAWGYNDLSSAGSGKFGGCFETWNRAAVIIQIEDQIGAANAEAIASVEGVDGLMAGPGDMALDLGIPMTEMFTDPVWGKHMGMIVGAAKKHDLACLMPGFFASPVPANLAMGVTMMTCANDGLILEQGLRKNLTEAAEFVQTWKDQNANGQGQNGQA